MRRTRYSSMGEDGFSSAFQPRFPDQLPTAGGLPHTQFVDRRPRMAELPVRGSALGAATCPLGQHDSRSHLLLVDRHASTTGVGAALTISKIANPHRA